MTDRHQAQSYPLRMPPELKERVVEEAKKSGRSIHAEIVHRLQKSFEPVAPMYRNRKSRYEDETEEYDSSKELGQSLIEISILKQYIENQAQAQQELIPLGKELQEMREVLRECKTFLIPMLAMKSADQLAQEKPSPYPASGTIATPKRK